MHEDFGKYSIQMKFRREKSSSILESRGAKITLDLEPYSTEPCCRGDSDVPVSVS